MKKIISYFKYAVLATVLITSCITREWDPVEDMEGLADTWSAQYVDHAMRYAIGPESIPKDTLSIDFTDSYRRNGDSVNVISSIFQIKDSLVVSVEGYIYAEKFWVHLYTVGAGIVNYEGKFRVDFYETGKDTPWACSEIGYSPSEKKYKYSQPYNKSVTKTNWY